MFRSLKLIFAAILAMALLFAFVWALTRPQGRPKVASPGLLSERAIQKILTSMGKMALRGKAEVSLSPDEVNALTEEYLEGAWRTKKDANDEERKRPGPYELDRACVAIGRQSMTLYFDFKYRGVPFYAEFRGVPTLEHHRLGFDASWMQIGAFPLPGFVANQILAKALNSPAYRKSLSMRDEIHAVRIEKGGLVLTLQR